MKWDRMAPSGYRGPHRVQAAPPEILRAPPRPGRGPPSPLWVAGRAGGDNGRVTPAAHHRKRRAPELADRRAELLASRGRGDPELAEVTEALRAELEGSARCTA